MSPDMATIVRALGLAIEAATWERVSSPPDYEQYEGHGDGWRIVIVRNPVDGHCDGAGSKGDTTCRLPEVLAKRAYARATGGTP